MAIASLRDGTAAFRTRPRDMMNPNDFVAAGTIPPTPSAYYICGPTASGKSALALETALTLNGEIVNADAFQLYRGIEILSAAPSAEERATIPHHLYGILDLTAKTDAGTYLRMARPVIREIQSRGKTPIIVGGSGLYLKFLTHGPSPLPTGNPTLRAELAARPLEDLVSQLRSLDPVEASRTALHNKRYVSRALEICLLTGRKASELRDQWQATTAALDSSLRGIFIQRTRPDLHHRIAQRTRTMLACGAIEEVSAMDGISTNASKAIGVPEIRRLLSGEITRSECEELIIAATRQYAKRQETWFRREKWLEIRHF